MRGRRLYHPRVQSYLGKTPYRSRNVLNRALAAYRTWSPSAHQMITAGDPYANYRQAMSRAVRALRRARSGGPVQVRSYARKGKIVRRYSRSKHLSNGRN